jgi:hypothetical protein
MDAGYCRPSFCGNNATAEARWTDDFTIVSATLADGTLVAFDITLTLDGTVARSNTYTVGDYDFFNYAATGQAYVTGLPGYGSFGPQIQKHTGLGGDHSGIEEFERNDGDSRIITSWLMIGQTYTLTHHLWAVAHSGETGELFAEAAFLNTATFAIAASGSGYDYITATGTRYDGVQTVPEPHVTALFGAVTIVMGLRAGRRRQP